ncbi:MULTISPECIES: serine hydrolase [Gammaproteobacteria]|uniref:serine hydrolase domain-containing protein n=1 Tax=Gammaproteobacteria TaxID=1236 RepID=UPI000DD002E7|nr:MULTISPECIES: serine hydrolase domain-containing protein [Gammaproteobacteria]RTE85486.1 class A beta-lactamase-related serine hydrolase [Aliidiomarina sp. B3213]TCZ89454.1 class A beta-lactamase-related serine hydrolase [Lysobacter sp. N42]
MSKQSFKKFLATTLACVASCLPMALHAQVPLHPEFQELFEQKLAEEEVPGGVFAIVIRDRVHQVHSYGVRALNDPTPVDENTVFRLASVSKTFAGTLASILQQHEYFSWHDPITQFVPDFQFEEPALANQIRLDHIVSHSAGLVPNAYDNLIEANYTMSRVLPYFQSINPMCEPGECYGYQNVLFNLLEPTIERTTGESYEQLVNDLLFEPLGMRQASIGLQALVDNDNSAMPHVKGRSTWFQRVPTHHYYNYPAAAGINASASDLSQWLIAHMGYRPEVIPNTVLTDIRTPRVRTSRDLRRRYWRRYLKDANYAAGWRQYNFNDHELYYHGGWVEGYRAMVAYSPEYSVGLVILMNAESNVISELGASFWSEVFPRLEVEQEIPFYHALTPEEDVPKAADIPPFFPQMGRSETALGLLNR